MAIKLALENTPISPTTLGLSSTNILVGQSIYYQGQRAVIKRLRFNLKEVDGESTGNIRASIYEGLTGTFGTDMRPENNPTPSSQSGQVSINSLTSSLTEYEFVFQSGIFLEPDTYYCIALNDINLTNVIGVNIDSSGSYGGNYFYYNGSTWTTSSSDTWFKLYVDAPNPLPGNV